MLSATEKVVKCSTENLQLHPNFWPREHVPIFSAIEPSSTLLAATGTSRLQATPSFGRAREKEKRERRDRVRERRDRVREQDGARARKTEQQRENQRISMRIDLEVLSSFDLITTTLQVTVSV